MKKKVFKKWVNWLNISIIVLSIMALVGESEDMLTFIFSKVIALIILCITLKLQLKHGREEVL